MGKFKSSAGSCLCQHVSDFRDVFISGCKVIFCQACGKSIVKQQCPQVTQQLSGSKLNATIVCLKDRPGRQSLIGESSATSSSSGPSKFATFVTSVQSICACRHTTFKINNSEVRNFFLKYNQTDPPDKSTLRKNYLPKCYEETSSKI
jgi:hypothetical protein